MGKDKHTRKERKRGKTEKKMEPDRDPKKKWLALGESSIKGGNREFIVIFVILQTFYFINRFSNTRRYFFYVFFFYFQLKKIFSFLDPGSYG